MTIKAIKETSTRKGTSGNLLKVIELGLQDRIYTALKLPGFSAEALAKEFGNEDIHISANAIRKFVKNTKKAQQEIIKTDMKESSNLIKLTMDYNSALMDILNEVEEVKKTVKEQKDYSMYNQLVGRLLQGIELFAKLTGDLRPKGTTDINIIYNEINSDIEKDMKELTKDFFGGKNKTVIDIDAEIKDEDEKVAKKMQLGEN